MLRLLLTGILGLIEPGSSTQLSVGMLISLGAAFAMITLRPYDNDNDNTLSVLSYIQISLVMMCGLVLKSQDLVESESFDKEILGYVLIAVNVLVLVTAVVLAVIQFKRSGEEDYSGFKKKLMGGKGKEMLMNDGEIELGDIYGRKGSEEFDSVNPVQKRARTKVGYARGDKTKGLKEPERLTDEDIDKMGPPPPPTFFTSPDVNDNL